MKIEHRILYGTLLLAALLTGLAGCDTANQPATPATPPSVMTSQPISPAGTAYPAPNGYPAPDNPDTTAYPAPTSAP
jgi:hypothetical protein